MKFHNENVMFIKAVSLKVRNLDDMLSFYKDIMGMKVLEQNDTMAVLGTESKSLLTLYKIDNSTKQMDTSGLYHVAYLLPTREDLGSFLKHLAINKVPIGAGDHLVSEALYFNDPEGNGIEVYADRPDATWTWSDDMVEMTTDPVDIEDLLKASNYDYKEMPEGTVIGHVHLSVVDIASHDKFYVKDLGYQLVSKFGDQAEFISDHAYHHHIAFNTWNHSVKVNPTDSDMGLYSMTIEMGNHDIRETLLNRLRSLSYEIMEVDGLPCVLDPSNTRILFDIERGK